MKLALLIEGSGTIIVVLFAALKLSRQAGRIEEGVRGLYKRLDRVERWIDDRRSH